MPWLEILDGVLWIAALGVTLFLGRIVYRRRDLPARLFLGMVLSVVVLQLCGLTESVFQLVVWLSAGATGRQLAGLVQVLQPLDTAALVSFGAFTLHLFLIFPTKSRVVQAWRWSPLLFYVPAAFLNGMILSRLFWEPERYRAFWGLERLGLGNNTLPAVFVMLALSLSVLRLTIIYFSRSRPLVRRQLTWLLWGWLVGGGLAILSDCLPRLTGLPSLASEVPGLEQLPSLILLGSFALSIVRHHTFDVAVVVNRTVVYVLLVLAITLLYGVLSVVLGGLLFSLTADMPLLLVALTSTVIVALIALPLRDAIQRLVDRVSLRSRVRYRRLLQDYSRVLTMLIDLPRLLHTIADQIEEALQPTGLAIVLAENEVHVSRSQVRPPGQPTQNGYRVRLSRGELAAHALWQEGASFSREHWLVGELAARHRTFYLPWRIYDLSSDLGEQWQSLEESSAHVFVPMNLRGVLVGWLVLGPRLSDISYTRRDLEFLSALADQSCVALENARLYGEMHKRATELALLAIVSSAISSSLDLERVLGTIVESVIQVVGGDKSAIFELDSRQDAMILRMSKGLSDDYVQARKKVSLDQKLAGQAVASQQPLIVSDVRDEPALEELVDWAQKEGYRAFVDVPLVGREGVLGILTVYFQDVHELSPDELEILTTFANQAAIAIENARLYLAVTRERDRARQLYQKTDAVLARRVEELTSIEEISRQLTGTLDLEQVLHLVLERGKQATEADRGVISLYDAERRVLHLLAQDGYPVELERYRTEPWPDSRGITGRVARTGTPALVPDVHQTPDYVEGAATSRSQISVPIIYEEQVIGIITLESDRLAAFTGEHLRFVEVLADHAAIGIHNAQLFQQVMEGRDRLQAVLNSTHDAVILFDRQGQAILINPRVREMLGPEVARRLRLTNLLDAEEIVQSDLLQATDLDTTYLGHLIRYVQDRPDEVVDIAFGFQKDRQKHYVEGTASPVFSVTGAVMGRVIVLRDVTRRQELEQFREDLTSMVVHNLQGPLAALITSLEILASGEDDDPAMADELLRIALSSGQKLYGRIESLLDIRKLEGKQMPLSLQALPLPGVIEMVVDEFSPMASALGVHLEADVALDLPLVQMDDEMIGRVLSNLLDNALKYTAEGGRIRVRATLDNSTERPVVRCAVSDTGIGIGEEHTEVIFDKFRQGKPAPRGSRQGMGIGLYFCKLGIKAHGGDIWVESEKEQGSTFYFTLPVAES